MAFDIKTLATINLAIQILLMIMLFFASFAVRKGDVQKHCNIIRFAVLLQIAAILFVMLPSILGYITHQSTGNLFLEMLLHHTLGIVLIGLWIYINLVYVKIIRWPGNFISIMRSAFVLWTLVFIIGLHIYIRIYF